MPESLQTSIALVKKETENIKEAVARIEINLNKHIEHCMMLEKEAEARRALVIEANDKKYASRNTQDIVYGGVKYVLVAVLSAILSGVLAIAIFKPH